MTPSGPPPQRRPGDGNDFDRRTDPNADFLGRQSAEGGGGFAWMVGELARKVTRGRRRHGQAGADRP